MIYQSQSRASIPNGVCTVLLLQIGPVAWQGAVLFSWRGLSAVVVSCRGFPAAVLVSWRGLSAVVLS
jgi:hypothetical protein